MSNEKEARVSQLYEILFTRTPDIDELTLARRYLGQNPDETKWQNFVHALILTNEFSYVD